MWLMTTDGFFSTVQDRDDHSAVFVRARVREDAEQLAVAVGAAMLETPAADYPFRVRVAKAEWARYVAERAHAIDYDNFKNAVASRQGTRRASMYAEIWGALRGLQRRA